MKIIGQTVTVVRTLLSRQRYRRIGIVIGLLYLIAFLLAIQDLTIPGGETMVMAEKISAMFRRKGFLLFEAVAILRTPLFALLVSPVNILIGTLLSLLVGLNLTMSYVAWKQPRACSVNKTTGLVGILPALLAGGACCAPTLLLIIGIQATATIITASQWMIPIAFLLLVGSLVWISQKTEPGFM